MAILDFFGFWTLRPCLIRQNQIWILKSGSWNHGVVIKQNVKFESGFLKANAKSGSSFYPDVAIYQFYPYEFYQNVIVLFPSLFIAKLWTVNCLNKLSEVSTDTCPSPSVILNPINPASGLVSWFHESGFGFRKSGLNKGNGFWNRFQFWYNQTGPAFSWSWSDVRFKMATWWPYWIVWFMDLASTLNVIRTLLVSVCRSLLIMSQFRSIHRPLLPLWAEWVFLVDHWSWICSWCK